MNILITVAYLTKAWGGVSTHVIDLCKYLLKNGNNVYVASSGGEYEKELEELGIKHYNVEFNGIQKNPKKMLETYKKLKKIVDDNDIEFIHTHCQTAIFFAQLFKVFNKIPYVWTSHINDAAMPRLFKIMHKLFKFHVIAVSTDLKNYLIKEINIPEKYITVINNGVPQENYSELNSNEKKELKKEYKIEDDEFVISLLGRITSVKGHRLLLEALSELNKENVIKKKIKVLFAGKVNNNDEQKYLDDNIEFARKNNININYIGFQRPRNVFGVSDLMVLPSYNEGFPIVCIESFFMKCPVIRSNTPGVIDTKDASIVFEIGDLQGLKESLKYLIEDEYARKKLSDKAYNLAVSKFTLEKMGEDTYKVYERLRGVK